MRFLQHFTQWDSFRILPTCPTCEGLLPFSPSRFDHTSTWERPSRWLYCDPPFFFSPRGVFELCNTVNQSWPDSCVGAYICSLANPQNLPELMSCGSKIWEGVVNMFDSQHKKKAETCNVKVRNNLQQLQYLYGIYIYTNICHKKSTKCR